MNSLQKQTVIVAFLMFCIATLGMPLSGISMCYEPADLNIRFFGKYRPEMFWGDNISLLNSANQVRCRPIDRIFYARHTFDVTTDFVYGKKTYDKNVAELLFTVRNKGVWGNPESIAATTATEIKFLDGLTGSHKHAFPRHIFWMRELWLRFVLNDPIGCDWGPEQSVTLGIFPFQLGRGIALGDAYAVGPELLGFYTDVAIDQYAPGAKLSGDLLPACLSYDLYVSILQNRAGSLGDTGLKIYGQQYGRRSCPARGFGAINFLTAARLQWYAFNNDCFGKLLFEPYLMYNNDPEQRVEFLGDASSKLLTVGLAGEFEASRWEFGFDYAVNIGRQDVKGWDRNVITAQKRNGRATLINSHVLVNASAGAPVFQNENAYKAPSSDPTVTAAGLVSNTGANAQKLINNAPQAQSNNKQLIGSVPGFTDAVGEVPLPTQPGVIKDQFYNAANRFRDPYENKYRGWMCVADAAWWVYERDWKVAVTAGAASGDENPNFEQIDGDYTGFIGIQEMYSGKRVRSAFALGGAGKLKRPLSVPEAEEAPSPFSSEISGFTNLVFTGAALYWTPTCWEKKFYWNPNVLAYWQQFPTKKFDIVNKTNLPVEARSYLGLEVNSFVKYNLLKDLVFFFVGSVFVPGGHYADIQGKPLNADQDKALDAFNNSGGTGPIPNIGKDTAITLNIGLEYSF